MKKILITGASGFVGKHLASKLKNEFELTLTTRKCIDGISLLDLSSDASVETFIANNENNQFDAVVHLAAQLININMNQKEQQTVFETNNKMSFNIAKLVEKLSIPVLINFSSLAVYPNIDGEYDENSNIQPSTNSECLYGLSKVCSENILDFLLKDKCRIVHIRAAQIYGEGSREDRIFSIMKNSILSKNCIEVYGNGLRTSSFVSVDSICNTVSNMINWEDAYGIYNVADENFSYLELAKRIKKQYGNKTTEIKLINKGSKARFTLSTQKLRELEDRHGYR